jgi:hypothetical protein
VSREGGGRGTDCESGHVVRHDRGVSFSIDGWGEGLEALREGRVVEILERLERRSWTGIGRLAAVCTVYVRVRVRVCGSCGSCVLS